MRKPKIILIVIMLILATLALAACGENNAGTTDKKPGQSDTPSVSKVILDMPEVTLDGDVARWGEVQFADEYTIEINGQIVLKDSVLQYGLLEGDTIRVKATSKNTDKYIDGEWSKPVTYEIQKPGTEKLNAPYVYVEGTMIRWEFVLNATAYIVSINGITETIHSTTYSDLPHGANVMVMAIDETGNYANSEWSNFVTISAGGEEEEYVEVTDFSAYAGTYLVENGSRVVNVSANTVTLDGETIRIFTKGKYAYAYDGSDYVEISRDGDNNAFLYKGYRFSKIVAGILIDEQKIGAYFSIDDDDDERLTLSNEKIYFDATAYGVFRFVDNEYIMFYRTKDEYVPFKCDAQLEINGKYYEKIRLASPSKFNFNLSETLYLSESGEIKFARLEAYEKGNDEVLCIVIGDRRIFVYEAGYKYFVDLKRVYIDLDEIRLENETYLAIEEMPLSRFLQNKMFISPETYDKILTSQDNETLSGSKITAYARKGTINYRLVEKAGSFYRMTVAESEITIGINTYYLATAKTYDFAGQYENNGEYIVLRKNGTITHGEKLYEIYDVNGKDYALNGNSIIPVNVEELGVTFNGTTYSSATLIVAGIEALKGIASSSTDRLYHIIYEKNKLDIFEFYVNEDNNVARYNGEEVQLLTDNSGNLVAIKTEKETISATISTVDGENALVIDGKVLYHKVVAEIPEKYLNKRYYPTGIDSKQDLPYTLILGKVDEKTAVAVANGEARNFAFIGNAYTTLMPEDYDTIITNGYSYDTEITRIGDVYIAENNHFLYNAKYFKFTGDGEIFFLNTTYCEVKVAREISDEYEGCFFFDANRRRITYVDTYRDNIALKSDTNRIENITNPQFVSYVYYIEYNGERTYLKNQMPRVIPGDRGHRFNDKDLEFVLCNIEYDVKKLNALTEEIFNEYLKTGTYYTYYFDDVTKGNFGYRSEYGYTAYAAFEFRAYNDVTHVGFAAGYEYSEYQRTVGNIDSSRISFNPNHFKSGASLIAENNAPDRCFYYDDYQVRYYVYQFGREAFEIGAVHYEPNEERFVSFTFSERYYLQYGNDMYHNVIRQTDTDAYDTTMKFGRYSDIALPSGVYGLYVPNGTFYRGTLQRIVMAKDGSAKLQSIAIVSNNGATSPITYDIMYDEVSGKYVFGYIRTWTENEKLKISAATHFSPVGEIDFSDGSINVLYYDATEEYEAFVYETNTFITKRIRPATASYLKIAINGFDFAARDMVGKTYGKLSGTTGVLFKPLSNSTCKVYVNYMTAKFFNADIYEYETINDNGTVKHKLLLIADDESLPLAVQIEIDVDSDGKVTILRDHNTATEFTKTDTLKFVDGIVEYKARAGIDRKETLTLDGVNNTVIFRVYDVYYGLDRDIDESELVTYTATEFWYNESGDTMYCVIGDKVAFLTFENGAPTKSNLYFYERGYTETFGQIEFYIPDTNEGESGNT